MHNDAVEIREARREYHREWRRQHPDKVQAAQQRFWQRKAQQRKKQDGEKGNE